MHVWAIVIVWFCFVLRQTVLMDDCPYCVFLRFRPYIEEPRFVTIPKGAEPLGISIVGGENGGIFVSKVTGGSIAQQHHLEFGDQLLEVRQKTLGEIQSLSLNWACVNLSLSVSPQFNGINLRNATEQQARLIIGQQCDTITILAQYNHTCTSWAITPSRYSAPYTWLCHVLEALCECPDVFISGSSRMESSISSHSTPDTPDSNIDTLSEQDEGTMTPPSKQATPTASPHR